MTVGSQMSELDWGGGGAFLSPPYKIGCQNTPYKLGLKRSLRQLFTILQGGHFFYFHFSWLFPNLRKFSITSWHGILAETEIIKLNMTGGLKLVR